MATKAVLRPVGIGWPSGSGPRDGVPGSMLTIRFWIALAGRSSAVASANTLPRTSGSRLRVATACPLSYRVPVTRPTSAPATAAPGSSTRSRPLASVNSTSIS